MKTNHKNLISNVEFELLPEWFKNAKTKNAKIEFTNNCLIWQDGIWERGIWERGTWQDGFKRIGFCKWNVYYSFDMIKIGCKIKSIEHWEFFFASNEEYSTKRNTHEFENIIKSYKLAKFALENKI